MAPDPPIAACYVVTDRRGDFFKAYPIGPPPVAMARLQAVERAAAIGGRVFLQDEHGRHELIFGSGLADLAVAVER